MQTNETAEQAAITTAEKWLALLDAGQYAETWNQTSSHFKSGIQTPSLFRSGISEQQWQSSLAALQTQFGKAVARNLKSQQHVEELPDEPAGEYVVLKYETSFARRKNVVETMILLKDQEDEWRVSSYHVVTIHSDF